MRLSFRELLRPRLRACKHTKESVKWRSRTWQWCACSRRQRIDVKIARSSSALICSPWWYHFHPAMTFHFQHLAGTVARSRWNFACWVVEEVSKMSSPLIETKLLSLWTSAREASSVPLRPKLSGNRNNRPCTVAPEAGTNSSKISWQLRHRQSPSSPKRWFKRHVTTGILQEFPNKVSLTSL